MDTPRSGPARPAPTLTREDLETTLNAVGDAITLQQPDGSIIWANQAAADLLGYDSPQSLIAAPIDELMKRFDVQDQRGNPFPADRLPGQLALAGVNPPETILRWRRDDSDEERWSLVQATPVFDEQSQLRFAVNIFRDMTASHTAIESRKRSEDRLAFMAAASRALLGASLDPEEIAELLTGIFVPSLGDLCAVWQPDNTGRVRRLAQRTGFGVRDAPDTGVTPGPVAKALRGEPILVERGEAGKRSSQVAVPIAGRSGPLGAILVETHAPMASLTHHDLQLAQEVGRRAGVAIENALLYAERAEAASVLSQSLVPSELPEIPGLELFGFVRPAASGVGGDFYDVVSMADGRSLMVIADVSGKGPKAAALTAMARYTLRTLAAYHTSPALLLAAVNDALIDQMPDGRFFSLACGAFGPSSKGIRVTVVVAGHPKPLILRASGEVESCGETGLPLGIFYTLDLVEREVVLEAGDSFVMITDGCVGEGGSGADELDRALRAAAGDPAEKLARVVERVGLGVQPEHLDDIACIVARVPAGEE